MKKVSVIYWSGTGNTQKMAEAIAEGASLDGVAVSLISVDKASHEDVLNSNALALGCPSMGDEALEEEEMEPFIHSLEGENLAGKPLALFGSYDWGDGQWMRDWTERMKNQGAALVDNGLIIQSTPDDAGEAKCKELGAKLASAAR
ncbi:MAG TPA: flavodoxin [Methylomusa anaerophila]|uniref:Flavodoxin n=1 Tax=Methylomusa anaerophila TaxID=1930071 RepID=A0A348AM50_9FIRM|nr:flavodoxin [Methylomusa anaerophila]BBB92148.1 flavodoxin [Methylomusa anaerophila]HML87838.1 flavodoxin [Methylomusa anaerophila]